MRPSLPLIRGLLAGFVVFFGLTFELFGQAKKNRVTFASVVESNFAKWDHNHDGKLTVQEVDAQVVNPKVNGDEAAAVAALHVYQRDHKNAPPLTKAQLLQSSKEKDSAERRDVQQKQAHFGSNFESFRNHINKAPKSIFATKEAPTLEGFKQGLLGDCYFLAAVAAALHADPPVFRRMFQSRPDGSCDVHFYSGHVVRLPRLTDAEIALSSSAGEQGVWLNALEKAFGEIKLQVRNARKNRGGDHFDLDIIARGGDPGDAIEVLCGSQSKSVNLRKGKAETLPPEVELLKHKNELHVLFSTALPRKFLCCCSVASKGKYPPGIVTDHCYSILGYDPRTQHVTVRNPWGNRFKPKGTPGFTNGYATEGGVFEVPLAEFVMIFESVSYQTLLPLKR